MRFDSLALQWWQRQRRRLIECRQLRAIGAGGGGLIVRERFDIELENAIGQPLLRYRAQRLRGCAFYLLQFGGVAIRRAAIDLVLRELCGLATAAINAFEAADRRGEKIGRASCREG